MVKQINTSWGGVADWYGELLSKEGTYQKEVILPNLLRLLRIKKGETILDIGCGTGFFARAFAEAGASVVGVDVGRELIAKAKSATLGSAKDGKPPLNPSLERRGGERPVYHVASADVMPFVKSGSMDKAVMVLSLQNIENAVGAIAEAARILKSFGQLFIVLNHPAFRIPQASSSEYDAKKNVQYRRLDAYMSEKKIAIDMHPGRSHEKARGALVVGHPEVTWSFHRPFQYYFKLFDKHNLAVTRLEEWTSHTKTPHGPRAVAENRARAEFPLFLCLVAEKQ